VYVEGQLQTREWEDQSGQKRYSTEVVLQNFGGTLQMLDSRGGGDGDRGGYDRGGYDRGGSSSGSGYGGGGSGGGGSRPAPVDEPYDDDIPF